MTILLCALIISVPVAVIVWVQTADFEAPEEAQITAKIKTLYLPKKVSEHVPLGYHSYSDYISSDFEWGLESDTHIDCDIRKSIGM